MQEYFVPKLYLSGFIHDFESVAARYETKRQIFEPGETLTVAGEINNTAHFIRSGLVHLSLIHSSGNPRSLLFFGPGTVFPIGVVPHENLIDYEMVLRALSRVETFSFSYPTLRRMCVENGELAAQILEENCEMMGYIFYQEMNQAYTSTEIRVCDILYLLLVSLYSENAVIPLSQEELAAMAGTSLPQLERVLRELRSQGIIETTRKKVRIRDKALLQKHCSTELRDDKQDM